VNNWLDWRRLYQMGLQMNVLSSKREFLVEYIKKELENGGVAATYIYHAPKKQLVSQSLELIANIHNIPFSPEQK
jgi:hypothetical protein